jgi:excisionase family DNA binding protein
MNSYGAQRTDANTVIGAGSSPRLALTRSEAARALGMSMDSFERYVQPELRLVRRGKLRLIPVAEVERWLSENSSRALDTGRL